MSSHAEINQAILREFRNLPLQDITVTGTDQVSIYNQIGAQLRPGKLGRYEEDQMTVYVFRHNWGYRLFYVDEPSCMNYVMANLHTDPARNSTVPGTPEFSFCNSLGVTVACIMHEGLASKGLEEYILALRKKRAAEVCGND